jgi:SSS family transporter
VSPRHAVILSFVGLYMLLCLAVGLWAMRVRDFFMAGRDLGILVTAIAIFSSLMSGFSFIGGPGLVYNMGMSSMWMAVGSGMGFFIAAVLVSKRLRLMAELRDSLSLPDVVAARYDSEAARFLTAIAILLGVLGYLATQIMAMSMALRSLLVQSGLAASIPVEACVAVTCAVLVFYCVTGGIVASVYTDLFQGAVMIVASILVFLAARAAFTGGITGMSEAIAADDPETMAPFGSVGILAGLSWMLVFALGAAGQPHVITKHMMFKRVGDLRSIIVVSLFASFSSIFLVTGIGLAMRALVVTGGHPELAHPDAAAPDFLQAYTNPVLAGVVFAGIFAAVMSTADSFLNIGAAAVVDDIPRAILGRPLRHELRMARLATAVIALAAALFGLYTGDLVALLGAFGWATFAAALVPTVAVGFNWKRATAPAACTAIVASLAINFSLKVFKIDLPWGIDGGAVALLASLVLFFAISFGSKPPALAPDIAEVMDM